jgi:formamidopyrimidine-DNA glycosylase
MPELPEVETVVRALHDPLIGRTFTDLECYWPNQIVIPDDVAQLRVRISGRTVTNVSRRAKYIVITLDGNETLIVHLKMTGHLAILPHDTPVHKHVRQRFILTDGFDLRFRDPRKFGRIYLVQDPQVILGKLGPEPLEPAFTAAVLQDRLAGKKRVLKPLLLDQSFVAGLGNIYADEALFDAQIMPTRHSNTLTDAEIGRLHNAIKKVLQLGIDREGASI